ncbi:MAG: putative toxin-antitoxin system toxin component, PIN family [bacterium]|nr:putative toxin-antitoxin system toxin component, PIN family [bacterium]
MRIVLDTNIFIAAALRGGFSEAVLEMVVDGQVVLVSSEEILDELQEKLSRKFSWEEEDIDIFVRRMREISIMVLPKGEMDVITRDPDDNKILACAVAGEANLIVTADKDLLKLKRFRRIGITHPNNLRYMFPAYFKQKRK